MKQVQIDGLVSAVLSSRVHVGGVVPSPGPAEALLSSLPSGLDEAGPRFSPKILLFHLHVLFGRSNSRPLHLTVEFRAEKGDRS